MDKEVNFIQTSSGRALDFLNPKPEDFDIEEIAHALSLLCRFGGHCLDFYSVAEHSVRCAWLAKEMGLSKELQLEALLHDASEAYLVDMPRPIKYVLQGYRDLEAILDKVIRQKFSLPEEMSPEVKLIDNILLATEKRDLMVVSDRPWSELPDPMNKKILPYDWKNAKDMFIVRYNALIDGEEYKGCKCG